MFWFERIYLGQSMEYFKFLVEKKETDHQSRILRLRDESSDLQGDEGVALSSLNTMKSRKGTEQRAERVEGCLSR